MVPHLIFLGALGKFLKGDSLSLLLFDIVVEALSRMLDAAVTTGQFLGFSIGLAGTLMMVSHLLFADDMLIFCDTNSNQVVFLRGILARFEVVLGLNINLGKSELVPIGDVQNMQELVEMLVCRQSSLPLKYLGLLLGATFKDKDNFESYFEKDGVDISLLEEIVFI